MFPFSYAQRASCLALPYMTVQGMQQNSQSQPQGSQLTQPGLWILGFTIELALLPEPTEAGFVALMGAISTLEAAIACVERRRPEAACAMLGSPLREADQARVGTRVRCDVTVDGAGLELLEGRETSETSDA
jgi:hypothetical protein